MSCEGESRGSVGMRDKGRPNYKISLPQGCVFQDGDCATIVTKQWVMRVGPVASVHQRASADETRTVASLVGPKLQSMTARSSRERVA